MSKALYEWKALSMNNKHYVYKMCKILSFLLFKYCDCVSIRIFYIVCSHKRKYQILTSIEVDISIK